MKKYRKYLLGLIALVVVAILGTIGGMVFATQSGEHLVSNVLTLDGTSAPAMITLEWTKVDGGSFTASGPATVTWYNNASYLVSVKATNPTTQLITGVYGKLTGWTGTNFKLEFHNPANGEWTNLGDGSAIAKACGFWDGGVVGGTYYFGPKATLGDNYNAGAIKDFEFRVTPLTTGTLKIDLVLVNGITEPANR